MVTKSYSSMEGPRYAAAVLGAPIYVDRCRLFSSPLLLSSLAPNSRYNSQSDMGAKKKKIEQSQGTERNEGGKSRQNDGMDDYGGIATVWECHTSMHVTRARGGYLHPDRKCALVVLSGRRRNLYILITLFLT